MASTKFLNPNASPYHPLGYFGPQHLQQSTTVQTHMLPQTPCMLCNCENPYSCKCCPYKQGHHLLSMHAHLQKGNVSPTMQKRSSRGTSGHRRQPPRRKWVPNKLKYEELDCQIALHGKTTLMIKNIPNKLKRKDLLYILDEHCMRENKNSASHAGTVMSAYDFAYLPMDFQSNANKGYAFVNFTSISGAAKACKSFHKMKWATLGWGGVRNSSKICEISIAKIQGIRNLVEHFQTSLFYCHTDEYLPVIFYSPCNGSSPASSATIVGWHVDCPAN